MTRSTIIALGLLCAVFAAVLAVVVRWIGRDRDALVQRFRAERLLQVEEAAREIQEDLDDIGEDLVFAAELVHAADSPADRQRELGALLAAVKFYRMVDVYDGRGELVLSVSDPRARPVDRTPFDAGIRATAQRALARGPGELETSGPLAPGQPWLRAFAEPLPAGAGALVVLVDTEPLFRGLDLITVRPDMRLLVLGPHGLPIPSSDAALAGGVQRGAGGVLGQLVASMRAGRSGTLRISARAPGASGLGDTDYVAAYAPVAVRGSAPWSIAVLASTTQLRAGQRAIIMRLGLAAGVIALGLLAFGAYVVVTSRRSVAVRERLRHADRLAHLHEKTEKILESIPTGVMALAADGTITAANRALRERLPASAIGGPLAGAFVDTPEPVVERLGALLALAISTDRPHSVHGEPLALFGDEGRFSVHAVPLASSASADVRALLVIEDLTDVRSLESQLLRAEKLATVGVLAAGIAHEIGTPLGIVRGRAEYLLGKLGEAHAQAGGVQVIVEQIDRVSRTLRELLDFSRVRPARVRAVEVGPVVRKVVELLRFEAERRGVRLLADIPAEVPLVAADPDQLEQVLVNLAMNGCDACCKGGEVRIAVEAARPSGDAPWSDVELVISDDGCGILPEHQHQVFDPFFTTKKRGQGTGLGLTVSAQIVRNHGGSIELTSAPGVGTRITVRWPVEASTAVRHEEVRHGLAG
ncbi:MAG: PAS domain-containing protein [Deltaproteobacteria bacterium]|nr:PAS domain-containing protein [Deltaproteobacteria bacterium]